MWTVESKDLNQTADAKADLYLSMTHKDNPQSWFSYVVAHS